MFDICDLVIFDFLSFVGTHLSHKSMSACTVQDKNLIDMQAYILTCGTGFDSKICSC
jgi:hypothetical protein